MIEIDLGRREVWGLGGKLRGWGRERWDTALSFQFREISSSFRPHPHTQLSVAGHTSTAGWEEISTLLPIHKPIAYRWSRKWGGG